nr:MtrAB system histidine kinase MtrB [Nesterenkonia alba]
MFRAVFFTGLLTVLGTGLISYFLVTQVTSGLYQERFDQVEIEATSGLSQGRQELQNIPSGERSEVEAAVREQMQQIAEGGNPQERDELLVPLEDGDNIFITDRGGRFIEDTDEVLSDELLEAVRSGSGQYYQPVSFTNAQGDVVPGVVFGVRVSTLPPGYNYGLFFVYDFSSVQDNVDFVFQAFLVASAVILLMNILIAAWVTRTVVRPVSQAAEVSERIADGQLDQRLAVVGEDEIARLGQSFNRMASTLQDQITQLANLSKMQQRFVSDVSHELRTPLSTVRIAADVLHESKDDFDPVSQRSAEILHHQVERFQALLSDLLEMSRFDAGAAELALSEVDLLELSKEVLATAKPLADRNGTPLYLVVQGQADQPGGFTAEVDRRRIDRILRNLVNNAIEHSESRPVDVVIASSPTAIAIAVRDHGVGMDPAEVAHVFDRFWRADPARARTTGGSGLGLSIATEDTRLHSGSLDAWGQKGQGACFRVVLPRRQAEPYRASPLALPPTYNPEDRQSITEDDLLPGHEVAYDRVHEQALYRKESS